MTAGPLEFPACCSRLLQEPDNDGAQKREHDPCSHQTELFSHLISLLVVVRVD